MTLRAVVMSLSAAVMTFSSQPVSAIKLRMKHSRVVKERNILRDSLAHFH